MRFKGTSRVRSLVSAALSVMLALPASGQVLFASEQATAPVTEPLAPASAQADATGAVLPLTTDQAVQMALEQNLTLQVQRIDPQLQDLRVAEVRTNWTPVASSSLTNNSQTVPPDSFLAGGTESITDDRFSGNVRVQQLLPTGGNYDVTWTGSRATTSNIFSSFNPTLRSGLTANFTQPLLRNFKVDSVRQQLLVSRKNREISDVQLRATVVGTVRNVKNAYWDLVSALEGLAVQQQGLELARQSLRDNRTRVEVGTMAPIDIVEAESEVARNEEAVILAEAQIRTAEDRLRALIMDPAQPDFWTVQLQPTERPSLQETDVDIDGAVRNALANRTDISQSKKLLEVNEINIGYFRNQVMPDVNFVANYGLLGLGGTQFSPLDITDPGAPRSITGERGFVDAVRDLFANAYPAWTVGVTIGYPIGRSFSEVNLARTRLAHSQAQTQLKQLELQVATQIRDLGRQVQTNLKRIDATRSARQFAERRLEAEQKKFSVGMSTSFLVFQAQRDLAQSRNNELRATLDYARSLVDFEAAQEASVGAGGPIQIAQQ